MKKFTIGLAVVFLTIGGLMTVFEFGNKLTVKLFLIAGAVSAMAGLAGFILSLVMAPGIARYAIAGVALFALLLGGLWYIYDKDAWGKRVGNLREEVEGLESEKDRLNQEIADLRGRAPSVITVAVTLRETVETTIFAPLPTTTISISEISTITITAQASAVTVTKIVQVDPGSESTESFQLRRSDEESESELRLKNAESGIREILSKSGGGGNGNNSGPNATGSPPEVGGSAPPPPSALSPPLTPSPPPAPPPPPSPPSNDGGKPGGEGVPESGKQNELATITEAEKKESRRIEENTRRKMQADPNYKPTQREKRAAGVVGLLDSITDSFELVILRVKDGDTFVGAKKDERTKTMTVRLSAIDAPELREPWGEGAKSFLINALGGARGTVRIKPIGPDKYGRLVAVVFRGGVINESIVRQGRARLIERYCEEYNRVSSCDNLIKAQDNARKNKLGIWGERPPDPKGLLESIFRSET